MNRLAILIDGNNFYKGCQLNFNRTDVDFRKLGLKLCEAVDGKLLRIYYYNAHVSPKIDPLGYQRQQKFFDNLRATPSITLKLGHLVYHRIRNDPAAMGSAQYFPTEKGIDVQIAVDMIRLGLLKSCEGTILVSGDSDYIYAVRFAKDLGSNLYIASFPQGGSTELRNEGDSYITMDYNFIQECFIRSTPMMRREPYIPSVISRPVNRAIQRQQIPQFDPDEDFDPQAFGIAPDTQKDEISNEENQSTKDKNESTTPDNDSTSPKEDNQPDAPA